MKRLLAALFGLLMAGVPSVHAADDITELFRATVVDNDVTVGALLKKGVNPNQRLPARGEAALVLAVREEAMKVFGLLMKTPGVDVNVQGPNGDTPLMLAAYKNNDAAVRALLAAGATVNRPGWTALHYAASVGNNVIVGLLVEKFAMIDALSPTGTTPLMMAARDGHVATVRLLLEEGADHRLRNGADFSAYDFAVLGNHREVADLLDPRYRQ